MKEVGMLSLIEALLKSIGKSKVLRNREKAQELCLEEEAQKLLS
jgi:hypothetical protein